MTPRRPTAALLMEHQAFLKRLARSLVFDDQRAEDVVQDSFVVALEKPMPAPARLRGWLAGIVRNKARRSHRRERRLRERHAHVARGEALPSTVDMAARLEAQRTIAAAVEALDEPGRSALVYRYFDGRKPARIARELRLPVRTVESRLRRAKESLRAALDQQFGERGRWQAALLPLIGSGSLVGASTAVSTGSSSASGTTVIGVTAMSSKAVAGFCIAAALAGAGIGWVAKPTPTDTVAEGAVDAGADDAGSAAGPQLQTSDLVVAHAEIAKLKKAVSDAQREADGLRQELAVARGEAKVPEGSEEQRKLAEALKAPRYSYEKFDKGLAQIDWKKSAEAIRELAPLIPKILESVAAGGTMAPELQKRAQELNAPLIQVAMVLKGAEVPGTGYNGPFTHPAVAANMVYASLIEAGKPLDEQQVQQLKEIGDRFVQEEAVLRERGKQEKFALAMLLGESEIKDRFYKAVDQILTPEQVDLLHPGSLRDRVQGDLFSAGLIWLGHFQGSFGANREAIAINVTKTAMAHFQIPEADRPAVVRLVSDWLQSFDEAALAPMDDMEKAAFVKMSRIRTGGAPMLALYKELAREMVANEDVVKRIQDSQYVLLPALTE